MLLSESQIAEIFADRKPLTHKAKARLAAPRRRKGRRRSVAVAIVKSKSQRKYRIESSLAGSHPMKFTIMVWWLPPRRSRIHLLKLCGHHAAHTNTLERRARRGVQRIPANCCHVHWITERYQRFSREQGCQYAEPCSAYDSLKSAIEYLGYHYGFYDPESSWDSRYPLWSE